MSLCALPASAAPASPVTLLVLGDSLSAAYNMPAESGWVSLLAAELERRRPGAFQVVNASISGETSSGGLARLPSALRDHAPALVIIALGSNDGLRGLPPASLRANLQRMIDLAREAGAKAALIGVELPVNYGEAYRERLRSVYRELAEAGQLPLLPFLLDAVARDLSNFQDDQVHPTAAAQPLILATVLDWLEPELAGLLAADEGTGGVRGKG